MKLTAAAEARRAQASATREQLDLNLVSLIDIFTILIFFLLSSTGEVETLPSSQGGQAAASRARRSSRSETVVVIVSGTEIIVDGRKVASVRRRDRSRRRCDRRR